MCLVISTRHASEYLKTCEVDSLGVVAIVWDHTFIFQIAVVWLEKLHYKALLLLVLFPRHFSLTHHVDMVLYVGWPFWWIQNVSEVKDILENIQPVFIFYSKILAAKWQWPEVGHVAGWKWHCSYHHVMWIQFHTLPHRRCMCLELCYLFTSMGSVNCKVTGTFYPTSLKGSN